MAGYGVWGSLVLAAVLLCREASGAPLVGGVFRPYYGVPAPAASACARTGPRLECGAQSSR